MGLEEGGDITTSSSDEAFARLAIVPRSSRAPTSSPSSRRNDEKFDRESRTSHWRGCDPEEDDVDEYDEDDESRFDLSVINIVILDGRCCDAVAAAVAAVASMTSSIAHAAVH